MKKTQKLKKIFRGSDRIPLALDQKINYDLLVKFNFYT